MNSIVLVAVAVGVLSLSGYAWRADFERYSILTVGVFKRIDRVPKRDADYECADPMCEASTVKSELRKWYKEVVVLGMPAIRYGGGEAHYCEDHISFELQQTADDESFTRTKPTGERLLVAVVEFIGWVNGDDVEVPFEDDSDLSRASSQVTTGMGDAMALVPVVVLIMFVAMGMAAVRGVRG